MASPIISYQKLLIEKTKDEDTTELDSSSGDLVSGRATWLPWRLPDAPDPEAPGRKGQPWIGAGMEMSKLVPKLVVKLSHEDGGFLMFTSDQKFLVEKVEDEDVMELTFPVQRP